MCFCLGGKALSSCAVHQLILFTSTHLCKSRFPNYSPRKTKYRNGLNVAPDLRNNFHNIKPNIKACEGKKKNHFALKIATLWYISFIFLDLTSVFKLICYLYLFLVEFLSFILGGGSIKMFQMQKGSISKLNWETLL
jgi:hypothetical protein